MKAVVRFASLHIWILASSASLLLLAGSGRAATAQDLTVAVYPGDNIQEFVEAHPAGTTFIIKSGVHRLQSITPKDGDTFIGEPGAVLSGAKLLTSFAREGSYWTAPGQTQQVRPHGRCVDDDVYDGCRYPEQLFIDGERLWQVTSLAAVRPGTWYFDYDADTIYFLDDPSGRSLETSVVEAAFQGPAHDVTIRGLVIEKYASRAQHGAIQGKESTNWTVVENELRLSHGSGLRIGAGMQVLNNYVHHNGQMGIGGIGDEVLVEGNEIAYNNTAGFSVTWEAGGTKFVKTRNLVLRNNYVHHNRGPGLWTDIDNIDSLIEGNTVESNTRAGIKHEISYAAVIRNNVVYRNGLGKDRWLWGAQILVQNSSNVDVYGNIVTVDAQVGDGIGIINQSRGTGLYGPHVSTDVYVHDNEITYLGAVGHSGVVDDTTDKLACSAEANNRFDNNTYYVPTIDGAYHWKWCQSYQWQQFRSQGQEAGGTTVVTVVEGTEGGPSIVQLRLTFAALGVFAIASGVAVARSRRRAVSRSGRAPPTEDVFRTRSTRE